MFKTHLYRKGTQNLYVMLNPIQLLRLRRVTNVHNMTIPADHNIPVMSILDLQDVTSNRVCSHRLNEVQSSSLETGGILSTVFCDEEVLKIVHLRPAHFISGCRIWDDVNDPTLPKIKLALRTTDGYTYSRRCCSHTIGKEIQGQPNAGKDVLEHCNDLQREDVLTTIITNFEDGLLPDIIFSASLDPSTVAVKQGVWVGINFDPVFSDFECRHERSLKIMSNGHIYIRPKSYLRVTL